MEILKSKIEVLNTQNEYIAVNSATTCSSYNRHDLVAVLAKDNEYYMVKNYENDKAAFKGEYIKINRDMFYLLGCTYSEDAKLELMSKKYKEYEAYLSDAIKQIS